MAERGTFQHGEILAQERNGGKSISATGTHH